MVREQVECKRIREAAAAEAEVEVEAAVAEPEPVLEPEPEPANEQQLEREPEPVPGSPTAAGVAAELQALETAERQRMEANLSFLDQSGKSQLAEQVRNFAKVAEFFHSKCGKHPSAALAFDLLSRNLSEIARSNRIGSCRNHRAGRHSTQSMSTWTRMQIDQVQQ